MCCLHPPGNVCLQAVASGAKSLQAQKGACAWIQNNEAQFLLFFVELIKLISHWERWAKEVGVGKFSRGFASAACRPKELSGCQVVGFGAIVKQSITDICTES